MEKFDVQTARKMLNTLKSVIEILDVTYSLFSDLGVDKRSLRCLVKSKDLCRATIMEAFILIAKDGNKDDSTKIR